MTFHNISRHFISGSCEKVTWAVSPRIARVTSSEDLRYKAYIVDSLSSLDLPLMLQTEADLLHLSQTYL